MGRGLRRSVVQSLFPSRVREKGKPEVKSDHVSQDFMQSGLENLQWWRLHNFSEQLDCPQSEKLFLLSSLNLSCFYLCPLSPILPLNTMVKDRHLSSWYPSHRYWGAAVRCLLAQEDQVPVLTVASTPVLHRLLVVYHHPFCTAVPKLDATCCCGLTSAE